ncbi:MAG: hypothetical protein V4580_00875 [Bacteroidota bacterium]
MKPSHFVKATALAAFTYVSFSLSAQTVIGSGTANKVPKFTVTGSTIGDSQIFDNGTGVGIGTTVIGGGDFLTVQKNLNAKTQIGVRNGTTGTAAQSSLYTFAIGSYMTMSSQAVNFTTSGMFEERGSTIQASTLNGFNIGTAGNSQLAFWTNNTKRMTIVGTGSVGIGTATPDKWFTVVSPTANTQVAKFADDARYIGLGRDEVAAFDLSGNSANLYLGGGGKITILSTGEVGIGTGAPYKKLSVNGDASFINTNGTSSFEILGNGQIPNRRGISIDGDPSGKFNFYIHGWQTNAGFYFKEGNGNSTLLAIDASGSSTFSVAPISPSVARDAIVVNDASTSVTNFKVKTDGKVYAREVNVQLTTFPDYVFNKDYKLAPLNEVESYINTNKHLKGFEAAGVYETNGMNMGEVVRLQQEKIEELTLYLIEQQKQLEELKQEMKSLKK